MLISTATNNFPSTTQLGIEVEMEGGSLPGGCHGWHCVRDGSLRNNPESGEYVTTPGLQEAGLHERLKHLFDVFNACESTLRPSSRCGVHVHLDATRISVEEMTKWALTYYAVEPILLAASGVNRNHNLFCLSAKDASPSLQLIQSMRYSGMWRSMNANSYKYASLNLGALMRHGTMEFRSLLTPSNVMDIEKWVNVLISIRNYSQNLDDIEELMTVSSAMGVNRFLRTIFSSEDLEYLGLPMEEMEAMCTDAIRYIQPAVYTKWDEETLHRKEAQEVQEKMYRGTAFSFNSSGQPHRVRRGSSRPSQRVIIDDVVPTQIDPPTAEAVERAREHSAAFWRMMEEQTAERRRNNLSDTVQEDS